MKIREVMTPPRLLVGFIALGAIALAANGEVLKRVSRPAEPVR